MAQAPKQAHSTIVITVAFVLLLGGGSVRANQHNEYEEIGIYPQREHSLTKPYQGSGMTIPNWDFIGNTMVTTSFIRLTTDTQSRLGGIWNKVPIYFPNWEVILEFKVAGHGKELFGDGMAFWYVKHPMQAGNVFGSADYFFGLGIFLDTYANQNGAHSHTHPYISAMINNATISYDHDRDGTHSEFAGCESKFRGVDHDTYLSIRYYNDSLTLRTDVDGSGNWEQCFHAEGVRLPTGLYMGVTAATGELSDNHDVISIKTYMLDAPYSASREDRSLIIPSAVDAAPHRDHAHDLPPPTSWLKFFFYSLLTIVGLAIVGGVGYVLYQKKQESSRKRFY
ncbi:Vesicular integral-membrane protein VIP36 [Tyrophagus putrescentiae]|nr:Vesicular integral-membrane protein VIP36 [Tyrophagus putrescentiae]